MSKAKIKDMDECGIDEREWQAVLTKIIRDEEMPDGKSSKELARYWGVGKDATRLRVDALMEQGLIERGWKFSLDASNRRQRIPAYKMIKK